MSESRTFITERLRTNEICGVTGQIPDICGLSSGNYFSGDGMIMSGGAESLMTAHSGVFDNLSGTVGNFEELHVDGISVFARNHLAYVFRYGGPPISVPSRLPRVTGSLDGNYTGLLAGTDSVFLEDTSSFATGDHIIIEPGGLYSDGSLEEHHTITGISYYFPEHCCNAQLSYSALEGADEFFHYLASPTNEGTVTFEAGDIVKIEGDDTIYTVEGVVYNNPTTRQINISPSLSQAAPDNACVCKVQPTLRTSGNLVYDHATGAIVANKYPELITKKTMSELNGDPYWDETNLFVRSNDLNDATDFIDYSSNTYTVNKHGEAHHTTGDSKATGIAHIDTDELGNGNDALKVFADDTWLYVAYQRDGLVVYDVSSSGALTYKDADRHQPTGGVDEMALNVWSDNADFIYVANDQGGIVSYKVDSSGNLTQIDNDIQATGGGSGCLAITGDHDYIYVAWADAGIHTYSVVAGTLTHIDSDAQSSSTANDVWADSSFVYVANGSTGLHTYSVDSYGNLTHIDSDSQGDDAHGVWGDGNFIYVANWQGGLLTYSVDSSGYLTFIDSDDQGGYYRDVWGYGNNIYVASDEGLYVYTRDGSGNLTFVETIGAASIYPKGVFADSSFIYLADGPYGVHTYSTNGTGSTINNVDPICTSSCILFDGSGDYLSISDHSTHKLSDTDITIDFWYKFRGHSTHGDLQLPPNDNQLNSVEQDAILTKGRWNQNAYKGWGFGLQNSGEDEHGGQQEYGHMIFYLCAGDGDGTKTKSLSTTGDVDDGNWHHVAVTHDVSSYQWSLYLNGELQESTIQSNLSYDVDGYDLLIGAGLKYTYESPENYNTPVTGHFSNCLMQDVRITKGIVRYTGDFIPECAYNFYSPQCVSTCYENKYLYLEKGYGSGVFDWHLTGYREYFVDISGIDVNITGEGTSGVLTMVYPE